MIFPHHPRCPVALGEASGCGEWDCVGSVSRRLRSLDVETHLTQAGLLAPPIVCGSTASPLDGSERLLTKAQVREHASHLLFSESVITGAFICYDFACIANEWPELLRGIFDAYRDGRVYDILIAQALDAISRGELGIDPRTGQKILNEERKRTGRYSLGWIADYLLGRADAKVRDFWRKRYAILESVPIELWPEDAAQYPRDDARNTVDIAIEQLRRYERGEFRNMGDHALQAETAFGMHLGGVWGVRTDPERVAALKSIMDRAYARTLADFQAIGFLRADGSEDQAAVKTAVAKAYGAAGACERCGGKGRVSNGKEYGGPPRRFKADTDQGYADRCAEHRARWEDANTIACKGADGGCDGTGLDIDSTPGLPRTDKGGISTSRDTLAESGDDDLERYAENEAAKIRETYLPFVESGVDKPINFRPNVLVASGRTSYEGVIQLIPRHVICPICNGHKRIAGIDCEDCEGLGVISGVRECIVARPGTLFCSVDFSAGELCTLAQCCLWVVGHSEMANIINATGNPGMLHTMFGAKLIGKTTEEMIALLKAGDVAAKNGRQGAKPFLFGVPGGMGAAKLVLTKRKRSEGYTTSPTGRVYPGIRFCILLGGERECGTEKVIEWKKRPTPPICKRCVETAEYLVKPQFYQMFPEVREYHDWVSRGVENDGVLPCLGPVDRDRGGLDFCSGANNGFQALLSDAVKSGWREVVRECYLDHESPLFDSHPLFLPHDEIFTEMIARRAHEASLRKVEIMIREGRKYVPDVTLAAAPALMTHWTKDAEPVYDRDGRLIPWSKAA